MNQNVLLRQSCLAGRRTNRNSLIAIRLLEIGFVSYFSLCPSVNAAVFAVSLTMRVRQLPRRTVNEWLRAEPEPCPSGGRAL